MTDQEFAQRAIALLDLTELGDAASDADVTALCTKAVGSDTIPPVAAVCVWPRHVAFARSLLPAGIRIATVVNFPSGDAGVADVVSATSAALAAGADEIDLVMPYRAFLGGDAAQADAMIRAVRHRVTGAARLKVILETGAYPDMGTVRSAAELAIAAGADFIKTSTGKIAQGASLDAATAMLEAIRAAGRPVGLKPSGGIRSLADARAYLGLADQIMGPAWAQAGTFRFGASGLWDVLAGALEGRDRISGAGY